MQVSVATHLVQTTPSYGCCLIVLRNQKRGLCRRLQKPLSRPPECTIPDPKSVARDSSPPRSKPPYSRPPRPPDSTPPDFRFQISDFRLQISDFRFLIADFRFQISDFRFHISDFGFQTRTGDRKTVRCPRINSDSRPPTKIRGSWLVCTQSTV